MAARITIEYDDQTSQGFQSLVRNFEKAEGAATGLAVAGNQTNAVMEQMVREQMAIASAIEQHTVATLGAAKRGFMEVTNTMFDFIRNMRAAGKSVIEFGDSVKDGIIHHIERRGAASAVISLASAFGRIGPQVVGARLALGAFHTLLDKTGNKVVAVSDDVSTEVKNMANAINSGHKTIQEVQEETGHSLEELGLKAETNYTRYKAAVGNFASSVGSDLAELGKAVADQHLVYPGALSDAKEFWGKLDKEATRWTDNLEENLEYGLELWDKYYNDIDPEIRKQKNKLDKKNELERPMRERIEAFEKTVQREMELQRELTDISRLETKEQVQTALSAERQKREAWTTSIQYRGRIEQRSQARIRALLKQEEALRVNHLNKMKAENEKVLADRLQAQKKWLTELRKSQQEEQQIRQEALKKQQELEEAHKKGQDQLNLEIKLQAIENTKQKVLAQGGSVKDMLFFDKQAAIERAKLATKSAKDEVEKARVASDLKIELLRLEQQAYRESESKKTEATKEAQRAQAEARKEAMERLKNQRDGAGRNLLEQEMAEQDRGDVVKEIARRRLAQQKQMNPSLGPEGQRRLERSVNKRAMQDAQRGLLQNREIAQAQRNLAVATAKKDGKQGNINSMVFDVIVQQARQAQQQEQQLAQQAEYIRSIRAVLTNKHPRGRMQL